MKRPAEPAEVSLQQQEHTLRCRGSWTAIGLGRTESQLARLRWPEGELRFDLSGISELDMAGAWLLHRTVRGLQDRGREVNVSGLSAKDERLIALVRERAGAAEGIPRLREPMFLEGIGRAAHEQLSDVLEFLAFLGHITFLALRILLTPATMYWKTVVKELETGGFDAMPIVGLLVFLIGVVIAYQGGVLLQTYGGSIFIADLVGLAVLRELSPLITAIIVAGRTGSAYTAEIGTMQVTEEVDALRSMGIAPIDLLVLPKLFAMMLALPLLTVFADIMGLTGGMLMANWQLDVSFLSFLQRLQQVVDLKAFMVGIGKAPVFAAIIVSVGCYQGFKVSGGAEAVGRHTTISVVQAIFLVILVDAIFSIIFSKLGI